MVIGSTKIANSILGAGFLNFKNLKFHAVWVLFFISTVASSMPGNSCSLNIFE